MVNVTISMDEETARWARIEAAKAGKSVSRWVGEVLAERRSKKDQSMTRVIADQKEALARFLATPPRDIGFYGRAPTREELYDEVLRRHERPAVREGQDESFEADQGERVDSSPKRKAGRSPKRTKST